MPNKKSAVKHDPSQTYLRHMSGIDRDGVQKSQLQVVREYKQGDTHNHYNYHGAYISNNTISGSTFSVAGDTVAPALSSKQFGQRSVKRKSDYNNNPFTYAPNHKNDIVKKNDDVTDLVSCDGDEDNNNELDNIVQGNNSCNPLQVMTRRNYDPKDGFQFVKYFDQCVRPLHDGGEGMLPSIAMKACQQHFREPSLCINTINRFREKMKLSESGKQLPSRGHYVDRKFRDFVFNKLI